MYLLPITYNIIVVKLYNNNLMLYEYTLISKIKITCIIFDQKLPLKFLLFKKRRNEM